MSTKIKFYILGNNVVMTKKEYVEKAKSAILNRIRFHAPIVFDGEVDLNVLKDEGIDTKKPIFKFDKVLNKHLLKAFMLAKREEEFNLLLPMDSLSVSGAKSVKKLKNVFLYSKYAPTKFIENMNKLNINYHSHSNYNLVYKDKFIKLNGEIINSKYEQFALSYATYNDKIAVSYKEFVLNGTNFWFRFINKSNVEKVQTLELNLPLPKGYFFFKKMNKYVLVENLLTRQKQYFNFMCKHAKFSFSSVDGLDNSVFCCINVKITLKLIPNKEQCIFFNFGNDKISSKSCGEIEKLFVMSQQKCREIFNVKVKTKNPKFDNYFNRILPHKIWINWLNGDFDLSLEQKYIVYKRLFVKGDKTISFVKFKEIGLRELGIYNGTYYKQIVIVLGDKKCLQIGKTHFYSTTSLTESLLKSREPISLCFGC